MSILNMIVTGLAFIALLVTIFIPTVAGFPTSAVVVGLGIILLGIGRYLHHKYKSEFVNDTEFMGVVLLVVGWLFLHGHQIKQIQSLLAQQG